MPNLFDALFFHEANVGRSRLSEARVAQSHSVDHLLDDFRYREHADGCRVRRFRDAQTSALGLNEHSEDEQLSILEVKVVAEQRARSSERGRHEAVVVPASQLQLDVGATRVVVVAEARDEGDCAVVVLRRPARTHHVAEVLVLEAELVDERKRVTQRRAHVEEGRPVEERKREIAQSSLGQHVRQILEPIQT